MFNGYGSNPVTSTNIKSYYFLVPIKKASCIHSSFHFSCTKKDFFFLIKCYNTTTGV